MGTKESIVTMAMRGDSDEPMSQENNIFLLEKIVADQRQILAEETRKPADQTPQLWALYKEVQDYYDKGMRVPDDVTLLLCDDNWGNLRKLPKLGDKPRRGGYGIYYHFDYVGGPRSYRWRNTNPLPRIWKQMHLAKAYGADQIWIVNVGDLKPMELPISFFLDYAWNPDALPANGVAAYTQRWAAQQFAQYAAEIADVLAKYAKYRLTLPQAGPVTVQAYLAPTLDFTNTTGLRYAVSLDEEAPQLINLHTGMKPGESNQPWEKAVVANIILKTSQHNVAAAGVHVLKFWRVDLGLVLEKLVLSQGPLPASYLGPPENAASGKPQEAPGR